MAKLETHWSKIPSGDGGGLPHAFPEREAYLSNERGGDFFFKKIFYDIYLSVCAVKGTECMPQHTCGGQGTT